MSNKEESNKPTVNLDLLKRLIPKWQFTKSVLNFCCDKDLEQEGVLNYHQQAVVFTSYNPDGKAGGQSFNSIEDINSDKVQLDVLVADSLGPLDDIDSLLSNMAKIDFNAAIMLVDEGDSSDLVAEYLQKVRQYFHRYDLALHRSDRCIVLTKGKRYFHEVDIDDEPLLAEPIVAEESTPPKKKRKAPAKKAIRKVEA